jgi:hypothetical protein
MKELDFPHNDWWRGKRPLLFGSNKPSNAVSQLVSTLVDASEFSKSVKEGIIKLEESRRYMKLKSSLTFQEQLRPLFCSTEINLVSASETLGEGNQVVTAKSSFWVSRFLGGKKDIEIKTESYLAASRALNLRFPETSAADADHPWLAPVRGHTNDLAISTLLKDGVVHFEFVTDVLAVDFKRPLFSSERCSLLALVPLQISNWENEFVKNLIAAETEGAKKLLEHIQRGVAASASSKLYLDSLQKSQTW